MIALPTSSPRHLLRSIWRGALILAGIAALCAIGAMGGIAAWVIYLLVSGS